LKDGSNAITTMNLMEIAVALVHPIYHFLWTATLDHVGCVCFSMTKCQNIAVALDHPYTPQLCTAPEGVRDPAQKHLCKSPIYHRTEMVRRAHQRQR
jgi:hypothetical protein